MLTKRLFHIWRRRMNFYNKKVRKIISIVIMVIVIAMIATAIIPYIM